MIHTFRRIFSVCACCMVTLSCVQAHVVLSEPKAMAGTYYKATMRVGHGCSGSATTGITVQVPDGFQGAKPQPKAGWVISTRKAKLAQPYNSHGKTVTEDVVEISWQAATPQNALPDAFYDEFSWMSRLPDQAGPVWIKVLQTCVQGQNNWTDVPTSGASTMGMKTPAVLLNIESADKGHHHH